MTTEFLNSAAEILGVPTGTLTPATAYGSIPEWDSVMHLRLVMELEARYGVSIPLEAIPQIRTLADLASAIGPAASVAASDGCPNRVHGERLDLFNELENE